MEIWQEKTAATWDSIGYSQCILSTLDPFFTGRTTKSNFSRQPKKTKTKKKKTKKQKKTKKL